VSRVEQPGRGWGWQGAQAAIAVLAAGFFLYALRELLNPFLLYLAFVALLMPFRGRRGHTALVSVATVLTALWVLDAAGSLLAPFVLAFVLAYILDPVVDRVGAHPRIGRTAAILAILAVVGGGLAAMLAVGIPEAVRQAGSLVGEIAGWVREVDPSDPPIDLPLLDEEALLATLNSVDAETVNAFLKRRGAEIATGAWEAVLGIGRSFGFLFSLLGYLVLTPVLTFYLLRDFDRITTAIDGLIPEHLRPTARGFAGEYDRLLSRYLRGQVATSVITGLITGLGLYLVGFPYAFILGTTVAILGVVPYLGLVASLAPAVIIALASGEVGVSLAKVAIVYGVAQAIESGVLSPRIVGGSVGLHPVWILLALSLGGFFFGFVGLLIGVPVAVGCKLLAIHLLERRGSVGVDTETEAASA